MSLITHTETNYCPFIIGDLLFSSSVPMAPFDSPTQLPAEYLEQINDGDLYPAELYQKIYIIRNHICIAMAGYKSEMKAFLQEFRMKCNIYESPLQTLDYNIVLKIMLDYDFAANYANSSLYLLIMGEQNGGLVTGGALHWGRWHHLATEVFGDVMASGSGSMDFLKKFAEPTTYELAEDPFRGLMAAHISVLAKWIAIEGTTGENIQNYWGGGFEMIFWNGKRFEKNEKFASLICRDRFTTDKELLPPPHIVNHYQYHKDVLFILSLRIGSFQTDEQGDLVHFSCTVVQRDLFLVPAIDLPPGLVEPPPFWSFSTHSVEVGYDIRDSEGVFFNPCSYNNHPDLSVDYDHDKATVRISMTKILNGTLTEGAAKFFNVPNAKLQ